MPKLCSKLSDLKNSFTNRGHFWGNHFEYQQSYVIFKIEHLIPYFCLFQYYFTPHLHKSNFLFFKCNFDSLKLTFWNLTLLCRLTDFFKDLIHMWSYSLLLVISISSCKLFFFNFSHVHQIYVAEVLIIHFLQLLPSKVFITIWVPKWGQFYGGCHSRSGSSSISISGL